MSVNSKIAASLFLLVFIIGCAGAQKPCQTRPECPAKKKQCPRSVAAKTTTPVAATAPAETENAAAADKALPESKTIILKIKSAPDDVHAFGLEIWFNPAVLKFKKLVRRDLMKKGFAVFGSNVVAPGKLRMGGIQPGETPIIMGASGELVEVEFRVLKDGPANLSIQKQVDDVSGWAFGSGAKSDAPSFSGFVIDQ